MPRKLIPALAGRTVRCILFDLGDTLWSRKDMGAWERLERTANVRAVTLLRQGAASSSLPAVSEEVLGKHLREAVEERLRYMIRQDPEFEPSGGLAVMHVLQEWGIEDSDSQRGEAIFEELRIRIPESRPLFDDVIPTLKTLRQRGFQMGIVTNRHWGGRLFQEDLQTMGLLEFFEPRHMAISVDLGIRKPNPAIFLHPLNALNIPPAQAVMVGDSLRSDIVGAKMLDIFTVWKPKPSVRSRAQLIASGAGAQAGQALTSAVDSTASSHLDDVPAGLYVTDDDYILAQVQSRGGKWDEHLHSEIKPELIIENLSDLLDIFIEVGVQ